MQSQSTLTAKILMRGGRVTRERSEYQSDERREAGEG